MAQNYMDKEKIKKYIEQSQAMVLYYLKDAQDLLDRSEEAKLKAREKQLIVEELKKQLEDNG